ncbi:MAG: hypothetical protein AAGC43_18130, partial [Bacteroidota bacterium]
FRNSVFYIIRIVSTRRVSSENYRHVFRKMGVPEGEQFFPQTYVSGKPWQSDACVENCGQKDVNGWFRSWPAKKSDIPTKLKRQLGIVRLFDRIRLFCRGWYG